MTPQNQVILHSALFSVAHCLFRPLSKNLVCIIEPHGGCPDNHHELIFLIFDAYNCCCIISLVIDYKYSLFKMEAYTCIFTLAAVGFVA